MHKSVYIFYFIKCPCQKSLTNKQVQFVTILTQVEAFFAQYPEAGAGLVARINALDGIRANIAWLKRNEQTIIDWLHQYFN